MVCLECEDGWEKTYAPGAVMQTVGFLLRHDDEWTTIAKECHAERGAGFRDVQDIPSYSIAELKVIDKGRGGGGLAKLSK